MDIIDLLAIALCVAVAVATFAGDAPVSWLRSAARLLAGGNGLLLPNGHFLSYRIIEGVGLGIASGLWLTAAPGRDKWFALAGFALGAWRVREGLRERPWDERMQTLMTRRRLPALRETTAGEANRLERVFRKDPNRSKQQFDELVAEQGAKQEARRASLWGEAASSLKAARQLQREIQAELEAVDDILGYMAKRMPFDREEMQGLALYRKEIEQELERLAELIHHLRR